MDGDGSGTAHKVIARTTCGGTRHRPDHDRFFICAAVGCRSFAVVRRVAHSGVLDAAYPGPEPDPRAQLAARWAGRIDRPVPILRPWLQAATDRSLVAVTKPATVMTIPCPSKVTSPASHALVPLHPEGSSLWSYLHAPFDDPDDIVELDFAGTSAVSAFERRRQNIKNSVKQDRAKAPNVHGTY
ncbi:hypothetical protein F5148DRAFT_1281764 [Russula earlei]|uniref:Uncharacterized protein n=1 Tax=Russula earlei TaxID=71964 RepID=A0ACC0UG07_9AGAM|nr:hypothetical protein F5148DRAFT_1281764 [Russula earlei]